MKKKNDSLDDVNGWFEAIRISSDESRLRRKKEKDEQKAAFIEEVKGFQPPTEEELKEWESMCMMDAGENLSSAVIMSLIKEVRNLRSKL